MKLIQIVPNYSPTVCGVGDYAGHLTREFEKLGVETQNIVASLNPTSQNEVIHLGTQSGQALKIALETSRVENVILHFSGYGYHPNGHCQWLSDGLSLWLRRSSARKVFSIFHEVYATGPIWRRSFWTSNGQKKIVREICAISECAWVTTEEGRQKINSIAPHLHPEIMPVFSNIGAPQSISSISDRDNTAVVFGGRGRYN